MILFYCLLLLLVCTPFAFKGQVINTFNYNIENGLPTNHIYGLLRDRYGYLWIATDKGAIRYNGYEFKIFNQSDGIANEDIWELVEDKKGRVWLSNISDELGYIYNNKYHNISAKGNHTVYPRDIHTYENGIVFSSKYITGDGRNNICLENNDTIHIFDLLNLFHPDLHAQTADASTITDEFNHTYAIVGKDKMYKISFCNMKPYAEFLLKISDTLVRELNNNFNGMIDNYLVSYPTVLKSNSFYSLKIPSGKLQKISLSKFSVDENINYIYFDVFGDKHIYVITDNNILKFKCKEDSVTFVSTINSKQLLDNSAIDADKVVTLHQDNYWGFCIGTTTNGLFLNYKEKNSFRKQESTGLESFSYKGGIRDSMSFWWSGLKSTLAKLGKDGKVQYFRYKNLKRVFSVMPYKQDTFILYGVYSYTFNNKTGALQQNNNLGSGARVAIIDSSGTYYMISSTCFGKICNNNTTCFDYDRYNGLIYDSVRKNYWAYNFDRVRIHGEKVDTLIGKEQLSDFGVRHVEKIAVDGYGNFFFKGSDNITMYDCDRNVHSGLFKNFNLKEAYLFVSDNTLIVAGRFGILFSKISGRNAISPPVFYPNIKNKNFNFVYDCVPSGRQLILNTDKGVYNVTIPSDSEMLLAEQDSMFYRYRLIVCSNDVQHNVTSGDTIFINQRDQALRFDVINPFGNGHARYKYRLANDTAWRELNANELTLPSFFKADNYYVLKLTLYDLVWISDPITIHLYIQPYWYQTTAGKRMIWTGISFLIISLLLITILLTRRWVLKNAQQKNMRMEVEFKSLYAQLNPHFVFNTLNIALNMIRKGKLEDATQHITRFSKLLRSYLDSSRGRFIPLSEEITNIRNYIEIQQIRFGNIFSYNIILSDAVYNPERILIPSLLLQPIVENAINHGLIPKEEHGHLHIEILSGAMTNEIICIIDDDGIGRRRSKSLHRDNAVKRESHGTNLVNELIDIINKYEKFRIEITYFDKENPQTGTRVQLSIKNYQHGKI